MTPAPYADQLEFIRALRAMGALHVKLEGLEVLFPQFETPVQPSAPAEFKKPTDDPDYYWTPDTDRPVDPTEKWAAFRAGSRPEEG